VAAARHGYLDRPRPSGLADVVEIVLDKGLVVDAYARVSLVGIELITIDARIVVASVDTYLRFAEAVSRLDIAASGSAETLPELFSDVPERVAKGKAKGVIEGAIDALGFDDER
jgi:gas vesicle structural protein